LVQDKSSLVDESFVLVIEECIVNTLLWQNRGVGFGTAVCGPMEPVFYIFCEVFKQLFLDRG